APLRADAGGAQADARPEPVLGAALHPAPRGRRPAPGVLPPPDPRGGWDVRRGGARDGHRPRVSVRGTGFPPRPGRPPRGRERLGSGPGNLWQGGGGKRRTRVVMLDLGGPLARGTPPQVLPGVPQALAALRALATPAGDPLAVCLVSDFHPTPEEVDAAFDEY